MHWGLNQMKKFFSEQEQVKSTHVVGMTQYYTHNFADPTCPNYVSTYDITSCVVVLIKNIDETKSCSAFGIAHLNLANVYFEDKAIENISSFIADFEKCGGNLATASIQLLGGLRTDINLVREKIMINMHIIANKKGMEGLTIKVPEDYKIDMSVESQKQGNGQNMSVAFDKKGTYIRKVTFKSGAIIDKVFYPSNCLLLSDENAKNIIPCDSSEYNRLKDRTNTFQVELNKLLKSNLLPSSSVYIAKIQEIKKLHCSIERSDSTLADYSASYSV